MVVKYAVEVFVDVVEHVHNLHGGAIVAKGCKPHNVTEVDCHLLKELGLHFARLLQRTHHWAVWGGGAQRMSRLIDSLEMSNTSSSHLLDMMSVNWWNTFSMYRRKEMSLWIRHWEILKPTFMIYEEKKMKFWALLSLPFISMPKAAHKIK